MVVAPDVREQLLPAEHLLGMAQEHLEHRELPRAELDRRTVDAGAAGAQVQHHVAGLQHRALGRPALPEVAAEPRDAATTGGDATEPGAVASAGSLA